MTARAMHPSVNPASTATRAAAVPVLRRGLACHGIQLDVPALWAIVDDLARALVPPPTPTKFRPDWTDRDERIATEDDQTEDIAALQALADELLAGDDWHEGGPRSAAERGLVTSERDWLIDAGDEIDRPIVLSLEADQ